MRIPLKSTIIPEKGDEPVTLATRPVGRIRPSALRKLRTDELGRPGPDRLVDAGTHPVHVLVENVRSAFNVGSILRTADAIRAAHVYLCGYTASADHPSVHKSALGAQDTVSWTHHASTGDALRAARSAGCTLVALEQTNAPSPVASLAPDRFPVCLVVGNEVDGISDELLSECDLAIELPQFGAKHSLNVAVAFGIGVYDVLRHWQRLSGTAV